LIKFIAKLTEKIKQGLQGNSLYSYSPWHSAIAEAFENVSTWQKYCQFCQSKYGG
jgi:hypothetical protein